MKFFRLFAALCMFLTGTNSGLFSQDRMVIDLSGKGWNLWYDRDVSWKNDKLFLSPDIHKLPVNIPTGGWVRLDTAADRKQVSVPGTVEEYLQKIPGPDGDLTGVSWWYRKVKIPSSKGNHKILLRFESARQRAEVYVNHQLAGYDLVGNTPFETDITNYAKPGEEVLLAVRITDPGGNFIWKDGLTMSWGKYKLPISHGFGGITGRVKLVSCTDVYIDNLYVQNQPSITDVKVFANVKNTTGKKVNRDIILTVNPGNFSGKTLFTTSLKNVSLNPGENVIPLQISASEAKIWDLEHPFLYTCHVALKQKDQELDSDQELFGFRWFEVSGLGEDAMFRLNGKRIVLRTSISWGFWPVNGIFPTPPQAEKQILTAKSMGLNMLNFHRCIGQPVSFEKADQLGLLYFEEPGNYKSGDNDTFARALMKEKWLRMVKRDRNHPSLIIYNMINEYGGGPDRTIQMHASDMQAAHAIDPSRIITHTSGWAKGKDIDDQSKMHMRPFDSIVHMNGWYDFHHAGGPAVWSQNLYKDPKDYHNNTDNAREIVYWGEEGAISTPPRLEKIKEELDTLPDLGWDGRMYLDWYNDFNSFIDRKFLRKSFPTVDALTTSMGAITMNHQGRRIENIRINNYTDGYAINGWEAEIIENHSGVVDCFRNPKGDPSIINYYNQPLYVAVKIRNQVLSSRDSIWADFFIVNEKDLKGSFTLKLNLKDEQDSLIYSKSIPVDVKGGNVYGQLLVKGVSVPVAGHTGMLTLSAEVSDGTNTVRALGHEQALSVNWKDQQLRGSGAVWEDGSRMQDFLRNAKSVVANPYTDQLKKTDWVIVAMPPAGSSFKVVPEAVFPKALHTTFFENQQINKSITDRLDRSLNFSVADGATPDPNVTMTENYAVRWEGALVPEISGSYEFNVQSSGAFTLILNGKEYLNNENAKGGNDNRFKINLDAKKPVIVRVDFHQIKGDSRFRLLWSAPQVNAPDPMKLLERVKNDGTKLIILDYADYWANLLNKNSVISYKGSFKVGTSWLGGDHFVKKHPLFDGLPVDCGMDWPYQAVVANGNDRLGLLMEGEELVAGAYHAFPMQLGTAVGVIPYGKGKIILSSLAIYDQVFSNDNTAEVARKLLCNFINY